MGTLASELLPIAEELSGAPRIYADANLPSGLVTSMRQELGWDVLFVLEHDDLRRAPDLVHYRKALDLGRTLLTLDRDFLDDRRFPLADSPGVIVLTAPDEPALLRLLKQLDQSELRAPGALALPFRGQKILMAPVEVE